MRESTIRGIYQNCYFSSVGWGEVRSCPQALTLAVDQDLDARTWDGGLVRSVKWGRRVLSAAEKLRGCCCALGRPSFWVQVDFIGISWATLDGQAGVKILMGVPIGAGGRTTLWARLIDVVVCCVRPLLRVQLAPYKQDVGSAPFPENEI